MVYRNNFIKLLLIGDSGVGKTSLMNRYVRNIFQQIYNTTIGADFLTKTLSYNDRELSIQIYDTAGSEKFRSIGTTFYRDADGCILVFDLHNINSFNNLEYWYNEFMVKADVLSPTEFPIIVFGNKSDIAGNRIDDSQIKMFCFKKNIKYYEISVKSNTDTINNGFYYLIDKIMSKNIFETIEIKTKETIDIKQEIKYCGCTIL